MNNYKPNIWEVVCAITIVTLTPIVLSFPQYSSEKYGTATVLHSMYVAVLILVFYSLILKLYDSFEGKDILDVSEYVGGKILKSITGILFTGFLLVMITFTMKEFGQDIENVMFSHSSTLNINLLFVIGMMFLAFFGLKGIFRFSSFLFPLIIIGFVLMFFSLMPRINIVNLTPILGKGPEAVFLKGAGDFGVYNSLLILLLIPPMVGNIKKTGYWSILSTSTIILFSLFLLATIIPYPSLNQKNFALFELTRYIGFGRFFQRLESIFTFLWILSCFIYLGVALTFTLSMLKKIFNLKYSLRLIPCLSLTILSCADLIPNYVAATNVRTFLYVYISPFLFYLYPLLILLFAKIKISGRKEQECQA